MECWQGADCRPMAGDYLPLLSILFPIQVRTLEGPDQWISYEAMLTESMLGSEELNDFATFVFCKLNQPELDHPANLFN